MVHQAVGVCNGGRALLPTSSGEIRLQNGAGYGARQESEGERGRTASRARAGGRQGEEEEGDMSPHAILGVSPGASQKEVKRAFRKLALNYHPDVSPGANSNTHFLHIKAAYDSIIANINSDRIRPPFEATPNPRTVHNCYSSGESDPQDFLSQLDLDLEDPWADILELVKSGGGYYCTE